MSILCATDFSPASAGNCRVAAALAHRFGDDLVVVHVVEPPTDVYAELTADARVWENALHESAERNLAEQVQKLRETGGDGPSGLKVEGKLVEGSAPIAINQAAEENGARVVVIGSHGRGALARFLMGSVAERTVQQARRPVLVVRGDTSGIEAWSRGERGLHVLAGIEGSAASVAALSWLETSLRAAGPCRFTLLHAFWPPQEYARLGLQRMADSPDAEGEVLRLVERDLRARLRGVAQGADLRIVPHYGQVGELIARTAAELKADVVVVGTHQRRGVEKLRLGSVAADTLHGSHVPVLCVPPSVVGEGAHPTLPRMLRVMAATDFSAAGNAAAMHAYAMLHGGGTVELVTVLAPEPAAGGKVTGAARQLAQEKLRALTPTGAEAAGIHTEIVVLESTHAAEAIMQAAERSAADAISVGSRGAPGVIDRLIVGSVADHLLRHSTRPIFLVRLPVT